jgi:hypothetical protein
MYEVPEEYRPVLDTSPDSDESGEGYKYYEVTIADLIKSKLLVAGQSLLMYYGPRGGEKKRYEATVLSDGSLKTLDREFSAPSYAALACIQNAGSPRETVNGWTSWKDQEGHTLSDLRVRFLDEKK